MLRDRGIQSHFYIDDSSGKTRETLAHNHLNIYYATDTTNRLLAWLYHWIGYIQLLIKIDTDIIEVYTSRHPLLIIPMVLIAKFVKIPCVIICRGELNPLYAKSQSKFQLACLTILLRICQLAVYKEPYMPKILNTLCPKTERYFWYNSIPINPTPLLTKESNTVLFLNRFLPMRHLDLIIRSAKHVKVAFPDVKFILVGQISHLLPYRALNNTAKTRRNEIIQYEKKLKDLVVRLNLSDVVELLPFTDNVQSFFSQAKVFLFPADTVFCNYALLESMERAVPAIVSDQKDPYARLIIKHLDNGIITPQDEYQLANAICLLLRNEPFRQSLAISARNTIIHKYNLDTNINALIHKYYELHR